MLTEELIERLPGQFDKLGVFSADDRGLPGDEVRERNLSEASFALYLPDLHQVGVFQLQHPLILVFTEFVLILTLTSATTSKQPSSTCWEGIFSLEGYFWANVPSPRPDLATRT